MDDPMEGFRVTLTAEQIKDLVLPRARTPMQVRIINGAASQGRTYVFGAWCVHNGLASVEELAGSSSRP